MSVDVFAADEQSVFEVDTERWAALATAVWEAEGISGGAEMSLMFVDITSMAELNSRFRGAQGPTDVLAFVMDEDPTAVESGRSPDAGGPGPGWTAADSTEMPNLLGDVVICPEVAAGNAAEHGSTLEEELSLLVVHGILHLRGFDHEEDDEATAMEAKEQQYLDLFFRHGAASSAGATAGTTAASDAGVMRNSPDSPDSPNSPGATPQEHP